MLVAVGRLRSRLRRLLKGKRSNAANQRLANHLRKHQEQLVPFLLELEVEATNWQAEQALRPAVVNRKVWGGNRTWRGARAQSILMTVFQTCVRQGRSAIDYVSQVLRRREHAPPLLPAPAD